eukprot:TRINITY_DN9650_c0_g2_i1.p1 TRINITY_DN9650_c0_g2~~TRINITY_DN9650_c0_g2_i1.p1  ORF type:complete len:287 (-),score=74.75 TRINITY_DN9650_c0_g2_i1:103-963(-)
MAKFFKREAVSQYRDRRFKGTQEDFERALLLSTTVYVGNLSFFTTEEQLLEVFSRCGEIKKIIMGLDKNNMTPCGFCFVLYYTREDTEDAVKYISGTIVDDRPIRVDFDWGYEDGRQWGRGRSGGQVRDEYRTDYDPGRGGYGKLVKKELNTQSRFGPASPPDFAMAPPPLLHHHHNRFHHRSSPGFSLPQSFSSRRDRNRDGDRPRYHGHKESGRKRQRDDGGTGPHNNARGGGGEGGGGGGEREEEGGKRPDGEEATEQRQERNPRFRERGDESDEEQVVEKAA